MNDPQKSFSVYLVEDSPIIRDRLQRLIDSEPDLLVVGVAGGAQAAIKGLASARPDAIVIDISLEDGDGFDVLTYANAIEPKPLVIMLTNYTYMSYRVRGLAGGAHYFFDKTTEFDDVIEVLKRHAQNGSASISRPEPKQMAKSGEDRIA